MPGKQYDGRDLGDAKNGVTNNSRAYCEGMEYRTTGTAAAKPITDNPHQSGSEAATAWAAGWTVADGKAEGTLTRDEAGPCALGGVAVPAAV